MSNLLVERPPVEAARSPSAPTPVPWPALTSAERSEAIAIESHVIRLAIASGFGSLVANAAGDAAHAGAVARILARRPRPAEGVQGEPYAHPALAPRWSDAPVPRWSGEATSCPDEAAPPWSDAPAEPSDRDDVHPDDRIWWADLSRRLDERDAFRRYAAECSRRDFDHEADVARALDRLEAGHPA